MDILMETFIILQHEKFAKKTILNMIIKNGIYQLQKGVLIANISLILTTLKKIIAN